MKNVYLVQRLKKPQGQINPFVFGGGLKNGGLSDEAMKLLKNILSFDYMGSAEFEWGAVPTAFKSLVKSKPIQFIINETKPIYCICPPVIENDVHKWVADASNGIHGYLKEHLGLKEALNGEKYADTKGWIKIEDDDRCEEPFMFFIDKEMFENVCKLFGIN